MPRTTVRRAPVDRIERRAISDLVPYAHNPRLHSPEQIEQLAGSMREHGQTQLIICDERGEIIAGHGRILAAERIGLKSLMVGVAVGWSDAQKRAYRIKDNQLALTSRWEGDLLRTELAELKAESYDLRLLGFEEGELTALSIPMANGEFDPSAEWSGMPEYSMKDTQQGYRTLIVHFVDQKAVDKFTKLLKIELSPAMRFIWYPEVPVETYADKRYTAAAET